MNYDYNNLNDQCLNVEDSSRAVFHYPPHLDAIKKTANLHKTICFCDQNIVVNLMYLYLHDLQT